MFRWTPHQSKRFWRMWTLPLFVAGIIGLPTRTSFELLPSLALPTITTIPMAEARSAAEVIGIPHRLVIPSAGIQADIDAVGVKDDGKLGVPDDPARVGWFQDSSKPGEEGTSILDGHLDIGRTPGAFWNLRRVRIGQRVYVFDDAGKRRVFRVTATKVYNVEGAPVAEIFADRAGKHLHLITCAGTWSKKLGHYDKRLVVFTEEVDEL